MGYLVPDDSGEKCTSLATLRFPSSSTFHSQLPGFSFQAINENQKRMRRSEERNVSLIESNDHCGSIHTRGSSRIESSFRRFLTLCTRHFFFTIETRQVDSSKALNVNLYRTSFFDICHHCR